MNTPPVNFNPILWLLGTPHTMAPLKISSLTEMGKAYLKDIRRKSPQLLQTHFTQVELTAILYSGGYIKRDNRGNERVFFLA